MAESGKWFAADVATFGDRLAGARRKRWRNGWACG